MAANLAQAVSIEILSLTPTLGAEIKGLDLASPLGDATVRTVAEALRVHGVLALRGSPIGDDAQVRFGRYFGVLGTFRSNHNDEGLAPEIYRVANTDGSGNLLPIDSERATLLTLNSFWHTDGSYRSIPPKGAILRGIEVVENGGDTLFANMVAAYEALPAAMRARIEPLSARHNFEFQVIKRRLPPMSDKERAWLPVVEHPLVRQHADGRRSLYLSPPYMESIVGWNQADSLALIAELEAWATQERFVYRHRWRVHDLVMWDNGWTMHRVDTYEMASQRRVLHGVLIVGTDAVRPVR